MRSLLTSLLVLVALTSLARAQAPPVSIGLSLVDGPDTAPPRITADDSGSPVGQLLLNYQIASGSYRDLRIELTLPPYVTPILSSHGTFAFNDCLPAPAGQTRTCRWSAATLSLSDQGVSGTINLSVRLDRWRWIDEQPVPLAAQATGFRTPAGGSEAAFTSNSASYTAIADARQHVLWQGGGLSVIGWVERDDGGVVENGLLMRLTTRITNNALGSAKAFGLSVTTTIGSGFEILDIDHDGDWGDPVQTNTGDATELTFPYLSDLPPLFLEGHFDSGFYHIDLFVPCSAFAGALNVPAYQTDTTALWDERTWAEGGGFTTQSHSLTMAGVVPSNLGVCGSGGELTKGSENWWPAPEDGFALSGVRVKAPTGVARATNALVTDAFPRGLAFKSFHTRAPTQFSFYACDFGTDHLEADVPLDYFLAHRDADCTLLTGAQLTPLPLTHLIGHAPVWGGDVPLSDFSMRYETYVPIGYVAAGLPTSTVNVAYASFDYTLNSVPGRAAADPDLSLADDPWKDDAPVTIDAAGGSCAVPWGMIEGPTALAPRSLDSKTGVAVFIPNIGTAAARLANPVMTVSLPPKVRAMNAVIRNFEPYKCPGMVLVQQPTSFPTSGPLTFAWTGLEPGIGPGGRCWDVVVTLEPEPDGWVNGESFTVRGQLDGDNNEPTCPGIQDHTFTVSVPAELTVEVAPSCSGNGGAPAFDVSARNSGGFDFTGGSLRFPIPAETTLVAVDVPPGATLECEIAGLLGACDDLGQADAIVASGFSLAAPDEAFTVHVDLQTSLPELSPITASATATVDQLQNPADSGVSAPFIVDDCRYPLQVIAFFDADGDGLEGGPGDVRLSGWSVTLSPAADPQAATAQTDDQGVATFIVRPGDYSVSETLPVPLDGQVWFAHGGQIQQSIDVPVDPAAPPTLRFPVGCSCAAQQCLAVAGSCAPEGCSYVDQPDCGSTPIYYVPLRGPDGDSVVVCTLDLTADPPALACQPPSSAVAAACGGN